MLGDLGPKAVPQEDANPFAGLGPFLEDDDKKVFKTIDGLVQRQEIIALNHLAQDIHWTSVKLGYPPGWSQLKKDPARSTYSHSYIYGTRAIETVAVPNKAWDQVNKTTEALLVDFPQVQCEPGDDSDQAEDACDLGNRFLEQQASEQGTNDAVLFNDRVARSLTCASSYIEGWTDPTGGGYVPLQIPAHPEAVSPMQPLVGSDGMPTTSPILRYVTSVGPDGQPTEESQFTDDPTQAAPQWQPKLMAAKWQREHLRVFPETASVENAEKVIILGYCTIAEGKKRWQSVAQMDPDSLNKLTDWTPPRYLALLPLFQRGRWKLTDGRDKEKAGGSDERIFFYYHLFAKAGPDHKKGADVVSTGAFAGLTLDKRLLAIEATLPPKAEPKPQPTATGALPPVEPEAVEPTAEAEPPKPRKEIRCMEIPVVQITPRGDPDEQDPTGRAYIEMAAGAIENNAHLAMSFSEALDKNLHLEGYVRSVSPITGQQREDARATGDLLPILSPEDKPVFGPVIPLDAAFVNMYKLANEEINSIGSTVKAANGQDQSDEKSGRAIQLATANNNVSLGGMNHAVNNAYSRWNRIKLQLAQRDFTTEQTINYVGEDGIYKSEAFKATDFALIGRVMVKAGTGGLLTPEAKTQDTAQLVGAGLLSPDEGKDAVRPAFSRRLGIATAPYEQRIERQIKAFEDGMPNDAWAAEWQGYQQQKAAFDQQQAVAAPNQGVMPGQAQTALLPPKQPWTPFSPLPTDEQPEVAAFRKRRLARLIDSAKFEAYAPEWQQVAIAEYMRMAGVEAAALQPPPQPGQQPPGKPEQPQPEQKPTGPQRPALQGAA
jgi:hypothetical protein